MSRKYVFIPKKVEELEKLCRCEHNSQIQLEFSNQGSSILCTLKDTEDSNACILQPTGNRSDGNSWTVDKFACLYKKLREDETTFPGEDEIVLAIHWGGIDSDQMRREKCDNVRKDLDVTIRTKLILTHYSGMTDSEGDGNILSRIGDSTGTIGEFVVRVEKRIKEEAFLRSMKSLQEIRQCLLSAFCLSTSEKMLNKKINEVRAKLNTSEIDNSILSQLKNKISEIEKSINEQDFVNGFSCKEKEHKIREYLDELFDNQLQQAGKEPVYGN